MERADWNRRYAERELLWSVGPNRFVEAETASLRPGRGLELACGEGRNALWLAERGWRMTGVDFSDVALDRARRIGRERGVEVEWVHADVRTWEPPRGAFDLVTVCYLHLPRHELEPLLGRAADAVAPGGTLLVVGHDRRNLEEGWGGPRDPAVLLDADEVAGALRGLQIERAGRVLRPVEEEGATAVDTLVRASRPPAPVARLADLEGSSGPLWGAASDDLNATLLAWGPGQGPSEHVNRERDVLLVVVAGGGTLRLDGTEHELAAGDVAILPKGAARGVVAGPDGIRYLTAHRRRGGLGIARAPRRE